MDNIDAYDADTDELPLLQKQGSVNNLIEKYEIQNVIIESSDSVHKLTPPIEPKTAKTKKISL
jgi:hypothetical protein